MAPGEYYGMEDALSRNGLNEKSGIGRSAMLSALFAKANGVDAGEVAGFRSHVYQATGNAGTLPDNLLLQIGKGIDKSKVHELLGRITQNTHVTANAMHGAPLTNNQMAGAAALATESMKTKGEIGTFAKSESFANFLQNGMQGGAGSPIGDIAIFRALGGYEGTLDLAKIHRMQRVKEEGFLEHPDMLKKVLDFGPQGDTATRAGYLDVAFPHWNIGPKGKELLVQMHESGFLDRVSSRKGNMLSNIEGMAKTDPEAAKWLKEIQSNPALGRQALESQKGLVKIEAGEKLSKLFEPIENSAIKLADAVANGKWDALKSLEPSSKTLLAAAGLLAAGSVLSFGGGLLNAGKGGAGLLRTLPAFMNNPLGWAVGGSALMYETFKDNGKGAPTPEQMLAITGKNPGDITKYSKRWTPYLEDFQKASKANKLPEDLLISVARAESGFRTNAISSKGAVGLMQLMPGTAQGLGVDPTDPKQNISGGARYLSSLMKKYDGDLEKVLSAYNWGPGNVDKYGVEKAPRETRDYVNRVKSNMAGYSADEQSNGDASNGSMKMITDILQIIAGHTQQSAINTTPSLKTPPLAVSAN